MIDARVTIPHPITLLHGKGAALACGRKGELEPDKLHGLFAGDTRLLSTYNLSVNGCPWHFLGHTRRGRGTAEWTFQNPKLSRGKAAIAEGTLFLRHLRRIHGAMHDDLTIRNYGNKRARFRLELCLDADFSDISR